MEFEELGRNDEHVIAKMHKLLLRFESEEEQIKYCMIKWATSFGYCLQMHTWERMAK